MSSLRVEQAVVELGPRRIVDGVDLEAPAGAVTALLGPNGAGKTTLIRAIAGIVSLRGRLRLGEDDLLAMPARERARRIGYVPQRSMLDAALSVAEVVLQGRYALSPDALRESRADHEAVAAALRMVDAAKLAERRFTELSGGERQLVLLARALAGGARCLVLDEPVAGLDVAHRLRFYALVRALAREGRTVLIALHELNEVLAHADHAVLLNAGKVAAAGTAAEVISPGPVRAAYGVELSFATGPTFALPGSEPAV